MTANDVVAAGVLPNDRSWVILSDGSRWEWIPEDGRGWERVHRGLPGVAWQPTTTERTVTQFARTFAPPLTGYEVTP